MHKKLLLSASALFAFTSATAATADSYTTLSDVKITAVSPNGVYVVGYKNAWDDQMYSGFVYNTTTGITEWKTAYDAADLDKSGQFYGVNNAGIFVGAMKDKDMQIEGSSSEFAPPRRQAPSRVDEDVTYTPITSAAIWKDGVVTKLGCGPHAVTEFSDGTDGSYACAVSADGKIVAGYIQQAWMKVLPCKWVYNDATSTYEYSELALPDGAMFGYVSGMSADGTAIYGTVSKDGQTYPCFWNAATGRGQRIILSDQELVESNADAISPDGKYLLVSGYNYTNPPIVAIYEVSTGEITEISLPDGMTGPHGFTISDNGDVLCALTNTSTWVASNYYYSMQTGAFVDFDHYLQSLDLDLDVLPTLNSSTPVGCSADFSVIVGNPDYSGQPWVLTMSPRQAVMLNTPQASQLYFSAPDKLTFSWKALESVPQEATLTAYKAYVGGTAVTMTPDQAVDGIFTCTVDKTPGTYSATVLAVASTAKGEIESSESEPLQVSLSADTSWKLFDNLDLTTLDSQGNPHAANDWWNASLPLGTQSEVIQWNIESNNFENDTPYFTTTSISASPWSSVLLSRFMNAKDVQDIFVSFYLGYQLVNTSTRADLDQDFLDLEYSENGADWKLLKSLCAADLKPAAWNFFKVEAPELAGKTYQIRFNAHGQGKGTLKWNLDCINVANTMDAPTPTGLKAVADEKNSVVNLEWHNTAGAYDLSYLVNSNILTDYCTGSEGVAMISAIDLTPEMTDPYAGKYITSLGCFLFDSPAIITNSPTKAEAIVYVDGQEVSRSAYGEEFNKPYATGIALEKPVLIEAGKSYRLGIRVFEYDPMQTPVYYQSAPEFIPGVTDLYSEDEGKTWGKLSDVYSNQEGGMGQCIWPIRAFISETDGAEIGTLDSQILAYNVLRDGEVINEIPAYAAHPSYTDAEPVAGASYAVQAFYRDGRVSPICEAVKAVSGVKNLLAEGITFDVTPTQISVSGEFERMEIFAIDGKCVVNTTATTVSTASLPNGIYVVRVSADGKVVSRKIAVRH